MLKFSNFEYSVDQRFKVTASDLSLEARSLNFLFGRNGSGKSTLLKGLAQSSKNHVAYLPTQPESSSEITGRDASEILDVSTPQLENTLLDFGAQAELASRKLAQLSTGQRKLVWLSLALNLKRDFIFLDEPTSSLDLCYSQRLAELLPRFQRLGKGFFIATHDFSFAREFKKSNAFLITEGKVWTARSVEETLFSEDFEASFNLTPGGPNEITISGNYRLNSESKGPGIHA